MHASVDLTFKRALQKSPSRGKRTGDLCAAESAMIVENALCAVTAALIDRRPIQPYSARRYASRDRARGKG
jgi:hypothetical protein